MNRQRIVITLMIGLILAMFAQAQDIEPFADEVNPDANISWPPPVYTLRGQTDLRGTVNLPTMANYFVEFRPLLAEAADETVERPWFPATLPGTNPIVENILGTWNTELVPDGLYEIRLTINTTQGTPVFARVSPVRIENNPPPFVVLEDIVLPTTTPSFNSSPTPLPASTRSSQDPLVTALVDANVRTGDDLIYDRVGFLLTGQTAPVIGISSFGSGWYYVELPDGLRGFIAPSIVNLEGSLSGLPRINPPPPPTPPATATPLPTATPETSANLHFIDLDLDPAVPVCDETFTIKVTVHNNGTTATNSSGSIAVSDTHVATGQVTENAVGGFPVLQPGESFVGIIPITVSTFFNDNHRITVTLDSRSEIPETNEGDNVVTETYTLAQGSCG